MLEEIILRLIGEKKTGKHLFELGYSNCTFCGEPKFLIDRKSTLIETDIESGGSLRMVDQKTIDQTDFPCHKNYYYLHYNSAIDDMRLRIPQIKKEIKEILDNRFGGINENKSMFYFTDDANNAIKDLYKILFDGTLEIDHTMFCIAGKAENHTHCIRNRSSCGKCNGQYKCSEHFVKHPCCGSTNYNNHNYTCINND
jgi:hypothetical protein